MLWTITGAGLVIYECFALARGRTTVSEYGHRWPQALLVWGWQAGLAIHLIRQWRKCEEQQDRLAR